MKYEELKAAAIAEAYLLHENTTQAERDNLNWEWFNPLGVCSCIYGQLTGNCYSFRARELADKCATLTKGSLCNVPENVVPIVEVPGLRRGSNLVDWTREFSMLEQFISVNKHHNNTAENKIIFNIVKYGKKQKSKMKTTKILMAAFFTVEADADTINSEGRANDRVKALAQEAVETFHDDNPSGEPDYNLDKRSIRVIARGLDEFLETHFLVTETLLREEPRSSLLQEIREQQGMAGLWTYAASLTKEFETKHENVEWGVDEGYEDWIDAVETFVKSKI